MRIQPVTPYNNYNVNVKPCQKNNKITNSISFQGNYEQVLENIFNRELMTRIDVSKAMSDLYFAALKEDGVVKTTIHPILADWLGHKPTYLIEELCKPIAKVQANLRDIIFNSTDKNLPVIRQGQDYLIYIVNFGKHGFFNNLFERESATNDMRIIFNGKIGDMEVSVNNKGKLEVEKFYHVSGNWYRDTYNMIMGDRIKHKHGNIHNGTIAPQAY